MVDNNTTLDLMTEQLKAARAQRQRRLVVLSGEQCWNRSIVRQWLEVHHFPHFVSIESDAFDEVGVGTVQAKYARRILGSDIDGLYFDAWSGFDPDALAISVGALSGGGLFILGVPNLAQWPSFSDPDYQRILVHPFSQADVSRRFLEFVRQSLDSAADTLIVEQGHDPQRINQSLSPTLDIQLSEKQESTSAESGELEDCKTFDQKKAVRGICKVATGHSRRPLVIRSDRGRGKSAALGIASGLLLKKNGMVIIVTSPVSESISRVFEHAARVLDVELTDNHLRFNDSKLLYIPPDELIRNHYDADLLLVDEAAAIPAAMLEQLLKRYNRIVFSTTVHGYEGTGRGFDIRFRNVLDAITPQWKSLELKEAIRWSEDDPVEQWLFDALLLGAKTAEKNLIMNASAEHCFTELLDRDELLRDHGCLSQLFGLLVLAHYQTSAADLRNLLDGPNVQVWVTRYKGQVVATALVAEEGQFDQDLCLAIWKGTRRPRGHLIPQTLTYHCGYQQAGQLSYQRIMRIAVHPALQRRGLGRQLTASIVRHARDTRADFIGSSFAATPDVLAFWRNIECVPVRLSFAKDASSGCHSALVLSALSASGEDLLATAQHRFDRQFHHELPLAFRELDAGLVIELIRKNGGADIEMDNQDWLDIETFADGYRQFELCRSILTRLVLLGFRHLSHCSDLTLREKHLLVRRVLQNESLVTVSEELEFTGKKQQVAALRVAIKKMSDGVRNN